MAFIVVEPTVLKPWAKKRNLDFNDELMLNPDLNKEVYESLMVIAKENKFNSLEKPKQMRLIKDMWTIEEDMLTPTMKTKRNVAKKKYQSVIEELYKFGPLKF